MFIEHISIVNFKNYREVQIELSEKLNCFAGFNASGKTNLLDAIHYLSFCKSFANPIDSQNILHDESFFLIKGIFSDAAQKYNVYCGVKKNHKKQFKLNNKDYQRLSDHIGKFPLVMISPYDTEIIREGSEVRRKLMDTVISQFNGEYLNKLITYNQVLKQRNALLKQFSENRNFNKENLQLWDAQMWEPAAYIFEKRKAFLESFIPIFNQYYGKISEQSDTVDIVYESHLSEGNFKELLEKSIEKDRILEHTTKGIHKDDLVFHINGYPVKRFGSQGQQKSFIIAVKLAEFEVIRQNKDIIPILLLDDIFDKLDDKRVMNLLTMVAEEKFGQILITDTNKERFEEIFRITGWKHKLFWVEQGTVKAIEQ